MKEKIEKILRWLHWHAPIITTRKSLNAFENSCMWLSERDQLFFRKSVADTAISSLQELRNNTWDKDRVDALIEFLETGKKTYNKKSVEFEIKVQDD